MKITPPLGPAPNPAPGAAPAVALEPTRRLVLELLVEEAGDAGATVDQLAAHVGGHVNTTRHHLRALVESGLATAAPAPTSGGRGRPATAYRATEEGRAALGAVGGGPGEEYLSLATAFAERLAAQGEDVAPQARAIGEDWGRRLVAVEAAPTDARASGPTRVVTRLLRRLGFSPEPAPAEAAPAEAANEEAANELAANEEPTRYAAPAGAREESPGTTVLLRTCPLLEAAREHPTVVCSVHLGLVAGALGALGESAHGVQLQPFSRPGACTLTLPPDRSAADATR